MYKSPFFNGKQIRGTIEIEGDKYTTDLSKSNLPHFIGASSFGDNDFITRLSDDFESIDMHQMGSIIFAPAKNNERDLNKVVTCEEYNKIIELELSAVRGA